MISDAENIDNMEFMAKFPDKFFDLAIADPPYFGGPDKRRFYGSEVNKLNIRRKDYPIVTAWELPTPDFFQELVRVSKNQIVWGINYFKDACLGSGRIVWDKCNADSSFSDCEIAYTSCHDSVRLFRYMWNGMLQGKSMQQGHIMQGNKRLNEKRIHTTQKPVALFKWQLQNYASAGDKILSTNMGSQSDRIAAYDMGFDYWGCDLDEQAFKDGNKRFELFKQQQKLFV